MTHLSIIFDLDGTLLDTLDNISDTANQVLAELQMGQHPTESYKKFVGDGLRTLMQRSCPSNTDDKTIDHSCTLFSKIYKENWKKNCRTYDGIPELLNTLTEMAVPLAVLSNKPHAFTKLFTEEFLPENMFQAVFGQRDGFAKKPDPAIALAIAKDLGSEPSNTIFVGDTAVDIETGKNGGMLTVGVLWGFRDKNELTAAHADFIISHPMELVDHVVSLT
ncbi:MAG: HAD family hydrolase [Desulforhopalus sp.]